VLHAFCCRVACISLVVSLFSFDGMAELHVDEAYPHETGSLRN
jgi:hypothetical protein